MLEYGTVPHWVTVARQQREQAERDAEQARGSNGPWPEFASASRGRHRAPRRWWSWPALALSATLLSGHNAAEVVGEAVVRSGGLPL